MPKFSALRAAVVPLLVLLTSSAAVVVIALLQRSAEQANRAQVTLAHLERDVGALQTMPMGTQGVPAARSEGKLRAGEAHVVSALARLQREAPIAPLGEATVALRANYVELSAVGEMTGFGEKVPSAMNLQGVQRMRAGQGRLMATTAALRANFQAVNRAYERRASGAVTQAMTGSAAAILLLVIGFVLVYRRAARARSAAQRVSEENARLAAANGDEARTDALTDLRNRRSLIEDLEAELPAAGGGRELALALFDLDGFKHYNDTFGHPAGDALLTRLGDCLKHAVADIGTAYRIGGDEFCILVPAGTDAAASVVQLAADALSETGDAFQIGCSHGTARLPQEASSPADALGLADQRMYQYKANRSSASRQSTDVLLTVLSERSAELREHLTSVAALSIETAQRLGLPEHEVKRIGLAAELHDIGKTAIPDAILNKPGPLDEHEWVFMRRHTLIGERIILAAPSLAPNAELVRSSHERIDGEGYPDALSGDAIPLGARIIAVSDAFDAMTSERPYRVARTIPEALAELRRCSDTQFDSHVVAAFCAIVEDPDFAQRGEPAPVTFELVP
jgi:diguanylate cyclase (GGDEF)-like protein